MSITNVLLIDISIKDYHIFVSSVNTSTVPIVYSSYTTRDEILLSLREYTSIDRIGIAFSNNTNVSFLEGEPFFNEPLEPFSNNTNFIISLIQQFSVKHIDYLACSTLNLPEWFNYYTKITEQTGVIVGASDDNTGNILYGGDWVLESTGQDIEMIYFTQNIEYYTYLLDSLSNFNVMIKQDNTIYFTGDSTNQNVPIGDSSLRKTLSPILGIDGLTISQIYSGNDHVGILMSNGDVYMCGRNNTTCCVFPDAFPRGTFTKIPNSTGLTPKAIACGNQTTYLLMNDASGSIYGIGLNNFGQLGLGTTASPRTTLQLMLNSTGKIPSSMVCGQDYLIITMTDGSYYGVGANPRNQLGSYVGNVLTMQPILNASGLTIQAATGQTPVQFGCGRDYIAFLMPNGAVYGLGYNNFGQMAGVASGQYNNYQLMTLPAGVTPVSVYCSVGNYYTMILDSSGNVYGTGVNNAGNLGINSVVTPQTSFQQMQLPGSLKATKIAAGSGGPIIIMNNGTVYGCGENTYGQLGLGNYTNPITTLQPMTMPSGLTATDVYAGVRMNFVRMNNGVIYATGINSQGSCGVGSVGAVYRGFTKITPFTYLPVMVEYGTGHMVVLTTTGVIYANGLNTNGQLGLGNTTTPVTTLSIMQNTTGLTPITIACGASHTVVLMNDASGSIYTTGLNTNGQLGIAAGNVTQQTSLAAGSQMQIVVNKIPRAINCGNFYTVVLMTDGTIYGTGLNSNGQLGIATGNVTQQTTLQLMQSVASKTPTEVACGASHTIVLMTDGTVYGTGLNTTGQLGIATGNTTQQTTLQLMQSVSGKTAKDIACGANHTIVLMTDGTVYGTGLNTNGQLGIATGNVTQQTTLQLMQGVDGKTPIAISCGTATTFVLMSDGSLYGTGIQSSGQLGLGLGQETYQAQYTTLQEITTISSVRKLPSSNIYLNSPNVQSICFKKDTQILTDKGYVPIQHLRTGDLIQTVSNGLVPIHMLGKRDMYHVAAKNRINDQLYVCTPEAYPEVFEPLVMTGCHSVLVKAFTSDKERQRTIEVNGNTYVTDRHYRLPVCADERAKVYDERGIHTIFHMSLENDDYYMNYGIYANGLLVETCSKRFLKELSNMEIL